MWDSAVADFGDSACYDPPLTVTKSRVLFGGLCANASSACIGIAFA